MSIQGSQNDYPAVTVAEDRQFSHPTRNASMANANNYEAPAMNSITPHLVCAGALESLEFYKQAFNAVENMRLLGPDGKLVHGSMRIGTSMLMIAEECPQWGSIGPLSLNGSPVTIHLMVPDVDAAVNQAVAAGATVIMPVADMFWGDRYGVIQDPFGHHWSLATPLRKLTQEEMQAAMLEACAAMPS
jgi:uncharacterized glyoxalase superfamily protein PhnB